MPATIDPLPTRDASHLSCWHSDSEIGEEFPGPTATVLTKRQKLRRQQLRNAKFGPNHCSLPMQQTKTIENFALLFEYASNFVAKTEDDDCIRLEFSREVFMLYHRLAAGGLIQQRHDGDYYCNAVGDAIQNAMVLVYAFLEQDRVESRKVVTALRAVLLPAPTDDFVCPPRQLL